MKNDLVYFFIGVVLPTYDFVSWIGQHFAKRYGKTARRLYRAVKRARRL